MPVTSVFIDLENMIKSLERYSIAPQEFIDALHRFVYSLGERSEIYIRGYASWGLYSTVINYLHSKGVEIRYVFSSKRQTSDGKTVIKNLADMQIAVDIFETLLHQPHVKRYIIVSGDVDFLPLVFMLRRHGKEVFVIADEMALAHPLAAAATMSFTYGDIVPGITSILDIQNSVDLDSLFRVAVQLAWMAEEMGYGISPSVMKELLSIHFGGFNEREWGFPNFKDFLRALVKKGLLEIKDHGKMLFSLTDKGRELAQHPYVPQSDIELVRSMKTSGVSGEKLINRLRDAAGKQGIRGGKNYWEYLLRTMKEGEEDAASKGKNLEDSSDS